MHKPGTTLFLTLILIVTRGESEISVGVSSSDQRCDYWDSPRSGGRCLSWVKGLPKAKNGNQRHSSTPHTPSNQPLKRDAVGNPRQQTQEQKAPIQVDEGGTRHQPSRSEETSPTVSVQPNGVSDRANQNEVVQTSESSQVSESAEFPEGGDSEHKVGPTRRELGSTGDHGREGGKGNGAILREKTPKPDSESVAQPQSLGVASGEWQRSTWGAETVREEKTENEEWRTSGERVPRHGNEFAARTQGGNAASGPERRNTLEIVAIDMDEQVSGEDSAQRERSLAHKRHTLILSAALILMSS
ncbi:uncharacterized protein TEOVI_000822000 [Trypanosoma equiperdum]|uniref:Expression site-associated gene 9 (ESAG9) protein n=1 Tax=Trypanosoma equiperdum TaxID=5694 RepID=A0A1G4I2N5_TRYEQ|nr:hypothetical protein TEOVI_000822000 [Trypanosoma equiperdum]